MKTQNTVLYILRLSVTLLLITAIMAGALAYINKITAPRIAALKEEKTQKAIEAVLPGGGQPLEVPQGSKLVSALYGSDTGYAVEVTPIGFDNTITMMVGVSRDGTVLGISIISHTETAGLGAVAAAKTSAGEAFRNQFAGLSGTVAVSKEGGQVDAITGATITSKAICQGVNAALDCVKAVQ